MNFYNFYIIIIMAGLFDYLLMFIVLVSFIGFIISHSKKNYLEYFNNHEI